MSQMDKLKLYKKFKDEQQKELNDFTSKYCEWAFGPEQIKAMLDRLGLTREEFENLYCAFAGGAMKKEAVPLWVDLCIKQHKELKQRMLSDKNFAIEAFKYEFYNYEVFIGDPTDALKALRLEWKDVLANVKLHTAYKKAMREYEDWCRDHI